MNTAELAAAFARLCKDDKAGGWQLAAPQCAGLHIETAVFETPDTAWQAIVETRPRAGWIQWQSSQRHFEDGLPEPVPEYGVLLAAEAVVSETESLRLDFLDGRWRLVRYRDDPGGATCLRDECHHLLHGADRRLCYRRYWRLHREQGAVQICTVLTGIE